MSSHLFHPKYRSDIDGLRAIAVLSVVIFHAFPKVLQGGFTGVDIFFVISGYLITSIIANSLNTQSFSFIEFYQRRVRRIFPALSVVLVFALGVGWISLLPSEFAQLGKHVMAGAGFASNLVLWSESGYFDNASETKPLLHLWSLGIEEQFYILFPLILWGAWKFHKKLPWILVCLILASFSTNLYLSKFDLVADFYAPYTRFWELMAGGLLAIWHSKRAIQPINTPATKHLNALSVFGLLLLIVGFLTIRSNVNFPGWRALLPTLGAVCLIAASSQTWVNRSLLSHPILRKIGLISYPLYLWHWPLLVFLRILKGPNASTEFRLAAIALSCLLAWLTYLLIEKPLRFGGKATTKSLGLVVVLFTIGVFGYQVQHLNGLPERAVVSLNISENSSDDGGTLGFTKPACQTPTAPANLLCSIDTRERPHLALIGDSKSEALFPGLVRTSSSANRWAFVSIADFAPLISAVPIYEKHQKPARIVLEQVLAIPGIDTVAIATATRKTFNLKTETDIRDLPESPLYPEAYVGLKQFVGELVAARKKVILVIDNPTLADPKDCLNRKTSVSWVNQLIGLDDANTDCNIAMADQMKLSALHRQLLTAIAQDFPGQVSVFDTLPLLCDQTTSQCNAHMNGRPMYGFTDHISDYAAGLVGSALNSRINTP